MASPTVYLDAPARSPRRGGIKTIAEFRENARVGTGAQVEFTSPGCDFPVDDIALCYPTGGNPQNEKDRFGYTTLNSVGENFGLYAAVECFAGGDNDFDAMARSLLEQGEDRGIEKRLNDWLTTLTAEATVTGGDLLEAVARAEDEADDSYLGEPIIVVNRGDLLRIGSLNFEWDGNVLRTKNGTRVLSSGQITAGSVSAIGSVGVIHTPITTTGVVTPTTNRELAIAERVYSLIVDCEFGIRYDVTT